ncbi:MAG TPA: 7TM diverse intracellular signaling domain-containing protein [Spirochaetota bacterium]|nr:7TM diverse intracellular signaling domain-containing protein [Spirochaetota bacterium]HPU87816.1 7TM diverse intracellular signaling domain-containing protein [Spirochaetota bacterium]
MGLRSLLPLVAALIVLSPAYGAPTERDMLVTVAPQSDMLLVGGAARVLADPDGALTPAEALASKNWRTNDGPFIRFGYTRAVVWVRWDILNAAGTERYLEIPQPATDRIDLSVFEAGAERATRKSVGDWFPFRNREIDHRNYVFSVPPRGVPATYLFRISSTSYITFRPVLWAGDAFARHDRFDLALIWAFFGIMIVMALYNLIIFVSVREGAYLFYVLLCLGYAVHIIACRGLGFQYLWPESPVWANIAPATFLIVIALMIMQFAVYFLRLKTEARRLYVAINIATAVILVNLVMTTVFHVGTFSNVGFLAAIGASFVISVYAVYRAAKGSRPALFYSAAWIWMFAMIIIGSLYTSGGLHIPFVSAWSIQIGGFVQTVLLSIGLADRINSMRRELIVLNTGLERKVMERTEELQAAMDELTALNENLADTNQRLEEAHRIARRDMDMAVTVQANFLPQEPPGSPEWECAFFFRPMAGVSGDFYDFYVADGRFAGVGIFDVSGHGIASGLVTMIAKSVILRAFAEGIGRGLNEVLENANVRLQTEIGGIDNYIAGSLLRFADGEVEFVNAGHTDVFRRSKGAVAPVRKADDSTLDGVFLGLSGFSYPYEVLRFAVDSGDCLLLYTDGLVEAEGPRQERYGHGRIMRSLANAPAEGAQAVRDAVVEDFFSFVGRDAALRDDVTVMVLRRR